MAFWDDLNPYKGLMDLVTKTPHFRAAAKVGARAADHPMARPTVQGILSGLSPAYGSAVLSGSSRSSRRPSGDAVGNRRIRPSDIIPQQQQQIPQPDPLGELYASLLEQLQAPVAVDEADLMNQIRAQFDPVFDARRAALEQMMQEAQGRSRTGREEVVGQYESLAQDYERLAPEQLAAAEEQRAATEQLYGELRSNIEGNYSRIQQEQADLFEQLGIEAAAPEVLEPQGQEAARAMTRADELGTLAQQRQSDIGALESDYYRSGAPIARLTGTNRSQQMLADLESYLRQRETDLGMVEAERTSGIQSAYTQLLQQAQQQAQQQEMFQQESLMNILMGQLQGQQQEPPDLTDPQTFLQSLPQGVGQGVLDAYTRIQREPEIIENKQTSQLNPVPGTLVPATTQLQMQMAEELLQQGAIDNATFQALLHFITLAEGEAFAPSPLG